MKLCFIVFVQTEAVKDMEAKLEEQEQNKLYLDQLLAMLKDRDPTLLHVINTSLASRYSKGNESLTNLFSMHFSIKCRQTKTSAIATANQSEEKHHKQPVRTQFENTQVEARENARDKLAIGVILVSDWLRMWREIFCDFFRKLVPRSRPIKCKTETISDLVLGFSRSLGSFFVLILSSHRLLKKFRSLRMAIVVSLILVS